MRFSSPVRRIGAIALTASAPLAGGCVIVVSDGDHIGRTYRYDEVRTFNVEYDHASPVRVETDRGSIRIRKANVQRVEVSARLYSRSEDRLAALGVHAGRSPDGALIVEVEWPGGGRRSGDAVSFDIAVPDAVGVAAHTGDGAITIEGLAGELVADTGDGAIVVRGHDGKVDARTGDGSIMLSDIVGDVFARSRDGAIKALGVAGAVDVQTGDGGVEVTLAPDSPGPARIHTGDGSVVLRIGPAFVGRLALQTRDGRVEVRQIESRVGAAIESLSRSLVALRFGDSDQRSLATTDDGNIVLSVLGLPKSK